MSWGGQGWQPTAPPQNPPAWGSPLSSVSQFWGAGGSLPGSIREGGEGGCHIKPALGENGVQGERGGLRMELEPPIILTLALGATLAPQNSGVGVTGWCHGS